MFEMLVSLSRHASFLDDQEPAWWFWHMMENVGLHLYTDHVYSYELSAERIVDDTLNRIIFRTYGADGHGGLFPLSRTPNDQRNVELWYQLNAYMIEQLELL
jgi:hypothetical protein